MRWPPTTRHTIIDGPPHAEQIARSCIIASDFVALPIEPSGLSTWASDLTVRQVREAQEYKETLKCGFVVSRKIGNTVIGRDIRDMAAESGHADPRSRDRAARGVRRKHDDGQDHLRVGSPAAPRRARSSA